MTDDDQDDRAPRENDAAAENRTAQEALLIRSARLDAARAGAKEQALAAGLDALAHRQGSRQKTVLSLAVLAAAAGAALLFGTKPVAVTPEPRVTPAAPPPSVAPAVLLSPPTCPELVIARGNAPLIEDFETKDSRVLTLDGRSGGWMTYDDGTGKQSPPGRSALFPSRIPGGRDKSQHGLHVSGGKFTLWGVTLGAELADAGCYDASAYAGVELWAKGPGNLRVGMQMIDVQDVKYGGLCTKDCYNTHRAVITLGKTFERHTVRWEDLRQLFQGGPPIAFDPRRVRFIEFGVAPGDTPFDLWIDDVSFIPR